MAYGCFPSKKAVKVEPVEYQTGTKIKTPTKVFLKDSSVAIFNKGFTAEDDTIKGVGTRHWLTYDIEKDHLQIPIDSIATMTTYQRTQNEGTILGSAILGVTGTILTPLSVYCISCPKCCFGSCPTVYTTDGENYELEAELFSYSLSRFFQETDVDRLIQKPTKEGLFSLRLTNEALETHYINQFLLQAVHHPQNSTIYPTADGNIVSVGQLKSPSSVSDSYGRDIKSLLSNRDTSWFKGVSDRFEKAENSLSRDWLTLTMAVPDTADTVKLVLKLRNTLLSTALFYDVVLASQGLKALEWTHRLNSDSLYAALYHMAYGSFSGMDIKVQYFDQQRKPFWKQVNSFRDVGPIAWKELAVELPVYRDTQGEMSIRLEWFPDNFMIDFLGYDIESNISNEAITSEQLTPTVVENNKGEATPEIITKIAAKDVNFLITNPGDTYYFHYMVPTKEETATTLLLRSSGYYTEWLRGSWITSPKGEYTFNLFEPDKTLEKLKQSWKDNRSLLESTFFKTRIPLKGNLQ